MAMLIKRQNADRIDGQHFAGKNRNIPVLFLIILGVLNMPRSMYYLGCPWYCCCNRGYYCY